MPHLWLLFGCCCLLAAGAVLARAIDRLRGGGPWSGPWCPRCRRGLYGCYRYCPQCGLESPPSGWEG